MIDILSRIINADLAICDLSSRNPNVMYELAVRQCFGKPVVIIKDEITTPPFDSSGIRYVEYDHSLRIDLVDGIVSRIKESIQSTIASQGKDVFSLLEVLGREKATITQSEISTDGLAILNAIERLGQTLQPPTNAKRVVAVSGNYQPFYGGNLIVPKTDIPLDKVRSIHYPAFGTEALNISNVSATVGSIISHYPSKMTAVLVGAGIYGSKQVIIARLTEGNVEFADDPNEFYQ